MKKMILIVFGLIFLSNLAIGKDIKVFMGYESYEQKERHMYINEFDYDIMGLRYGEGRKEIFKHAVKCMNDSYWYKAKLISYKGKNNFYSYKFKFYWTLNSKVMYVDVNEDTLSCRE